MKIVAIDVEEEGRVYRYTGSMEFVESVEIKKSEGNETTTNVVDGTCVCGHSESEHLPECIYKVEGCGCEGYVEAKGEREKAKG